MTFIIHTNIDLYLLMFYSFCHELLIRQSSLGSNRLVVPPREIPQSWSFHVGQKIGRRGNLITNWMARIFFSIFHFFSLFFLTFRLQQLTCLLWQLTWPNCLVTNLNTWASLLKVPSNQDTTDTRQYSRILWRSELLLMHYA